MRWRVLEAERGELRELPKVIPGGEWHPPAGIAPGGSQLGFRKLSAFPCLPCTVLRGRKCQKMPRYSCARPSYLRCTSPCRRLPAPLPARPSAVLTGCGAEGRGCGCAAGSVPASLAGLVLLPQLPMWGRGWGCSGGCSGSAQGMLKGMLELLMECSGMLRECSGMLGGTQGCSGVLRGCSRNAHGDAQEGVEHPAAQHPPLEQRDLQAWESRWQPQVPRLSPRLRGGDGVAKRVPCSPPGAPRAASGALCCSAAAPAPLSPGGVAQGMPPSPSLHGSARSACSKPGCEREEPPGAATPADRKSVV